MTKILCVSNTAFSIYNFRLGLMRALRNEGFEVVAVAPEDEFSERIAPEDKLSEKIGREGFKFIPIRHLSRRINPVQDIRLTFELYRIYRKEKPGLVLQFTIKPNIYGTIASRLAGTKSICTVTGLGYLFIKKTFFAAVAKISYSKILSFSERVIFQNKENKDLFVQNKMLEGAKTLQTPGTGVDTCHFSPEFCQNSRNDPDGVIFVLIARMLWSKGVGEFVEAAKVVKQKYPFAKFRLLGMIDKKNPSGIDEDIIRNWDAGMIVEYLGSTIDVRPFICEADVVVLPSYYREGVPRSLLEAMAMGKPIITTDSIGCSDVVEDGKNGFLVDVKNPQSLSMAMITFIELSTEQRKQMGIYGRQKVLKEFDENIVIDIYLKTIKKVLN